MIFKNNYKDKAFKNKWKIIKRDVKIFKKLCIKEFRNNIKRGLPQTTVDFFNHVTYEFENEISDIVFSELKEKYPDINFKIAYRHCKNSYKGIQMDAK